MCNDNDDKKSETRSQYIVDNSLYVSDSDISRISWFAAISMYQDSIVLCMFLTDCALWDRYNKNMWIWFLWYDCALKSVLYLIIFFFVHSLWIILWISSSDIFLFFIFNLCCTSSYYALKYWCIFIKSSVQSSVHSVFKDINF